MTDPLLDPRSGPVPGPQLFDTAAPVVRLRSPADVVAAVPVLLGFHPSESLVVVALNGDRQRVSLVQRVDLADLADPADGSRGVARLAGNAARSHAGAALAVVVTDRPVALGQPLPFRGLVDSLTTACDDADLPLFDALLVSGGRWFSFLCHDPECCSPQGTPIPARGSTEIEAAAVVAGMVVHPDRAAAVARVAPAGSVAVHAVGEAMARVRVHDEAFDGDAALALAQSAAERVAVGPLDVGVAARLVLALQDVPIRDRLLGESAGPRGEALLPLWLELTRRSPTVFVPAPATVLAGTAYCLGEGLLASAALDRALDADPRYTLARYLEALLDAATPPETIRATFAAALAEVLGQPPARRRSARRSGRRVSSRTTRGRGSSPPRAPA